MKKRFSMFPEPQKLKNYEFLRFLGATISKKSKFQKKRKKCSQSQKMLRKQFKHIQQQKKLRISEIVEILQTNKKTKITRNMKKNQKRKIDFSTFSTFHKKKEIRIGMLMSFEQTCNRNARGHHFSAATWPQCQLQLCCDELRSSPDEV